MFYEVMSVFGNMAIVGKFSMTSIKLLPNKVINHRLTLHKTKRVRFILRNQCVPRRTLLTSVIQHHSVNDVQGKSRCLF